VIEIGLVKVAVRHPVAVLVVVAVPSTVPEAFRSVTVLPVFVEAAQNLIETTLPARLELNLTPTVTAEVEVTAEVVGVAVAGNSEKSAVVVVNVQVFGDAIAVPPVLLADTDAV
jgi:hypothetical protein